MCLVSYPLLYFYVFPLSFLVYMLFVYMHSFFLFFSSIYCLNCFFLDLSFSPLSFVRSFRYKPHRFLRKGKKQKRANIVCMCVRVRVHVHVRVCQCACVPPLFQCASVVLHTHTHTHTQIRVDREKGMIASGRCKEKEMLAAQGTVGTLGDCF